MIFILADDLGWRDIGCFGYDDSVVADRAGPLQGWVARGCTAAAPFGILRIYLPAAKQPVDVDWIEVALDERATPRRWEL